VRAWRAVIRVTGSAGRFEEFRERLRWLLVRDPDAGSYSEHHGPGQLEYHFEIRKGIPFPAFAAATSEFPELRVEAEWRNELQASAGRAVIEHGRLIEQHTETIDGREALGVDIAVSAQGELLLAFVVRQEGGTASGYAVSADRQAYFRFERGRLDLIEPDPGLEDLAFDFAGRWLWYDESPPEESAIERARQLVEVARAAREAVHADEHVGIPRLAPLQVGDAVQSRSRGALHALLARQHA